VFENRLVRRIVGFKREVVTRGWRGSRNEESLNQTILELPTTGICDGWDL
jgi:hypothetical protein